MFLILSALLVSYANGANDNFKGVATIYGSKTASYRTALMWATLTTFAGAMVSLMLAKGLLAAFSGKGLVPNEILKDPSFAVAVALAAGLTVMIATLAGLPISTTHALTGGLVGAGFMAVRDNLNVTMLGQTFFLPLIVSPIVAVISAYLLYWIFSRMSGRVIQLSSGEASELYSDGPAKIAESAGSEFGGVSVHRLRDQMHFLSAGSVSFARGMNDAPKIAAMLLIGSSVVSANVAILLVSVTMAIGGWINSKKVATTMSNKIVDLSREQGLVSNLITSAIVIFASKFGFPVSTTHVSCGALFGLGAANRTAKLATIMQILAAWITTLPLAIFLGASVYWILK